MAQLEDLKRSSMEAAESDMTGGYGAGAGGHHGHHTRGKGASDRRPLGSPHHGGPGSRGHWPPPRHARGQESRRTDASIEGFDALFIAILEKQAADGRVDRKDIVDTLLMKYTVFDGNDDGLSATVDASATIHALMKKHMTIAANDVVDELLRKWTTFFDEDDLRKNPNAKG